MARKKAKILIIDDEKDFCYFVKTNMELSGKFKVFISTSSWRGILTALWHKPDLILLDIMMPRTDGFEVLKRLKRYDQLMNIPVVMLTARDEDHYKIKAAGLYDEDYIVKPVQVEKLRAKIEITLARFGKKV